MDSEGRLLHQIDKKHGLRDETIVSMYYDASGMLWLALLDGLARVDIETPLSRFDARAGVTSAVNAIMKHRGMVYIGTNRGVYHLQAADEIGGKKLSPSFEPVTGINSFGWAFYSDGETLLAGTDKGVYEVRGKTASRLPSTTPSVFIPYKYRVRGFQKSTEDPDRLYMAIQTGLGVLQKRNGQWQFNGRVQGLSKEVVSIVSNQHDDIWLAEKASDLIKVENITPIANPDTIFTFTAKVSRYGEQNGVPAGDNQIFSINNDFVFTSMTGLLEFDKNETRFISSGQFGEQFADQNHYVSLMAEESRGRVWIFSHPQNDWQLGYVSTQQDGSFIWQDTPFRPISAVGEINTIYPEGNGVVWFGGSEGVIRYDPAVTTKDYATPFRTLIRSVTTGEDSLVFAGARTLSQQQWPDPLLPYSKRALRFKYASTFYESVNEKRDQYRLDGFSDDWSQWSRETQKDYTNLPEGDYVFRVRGRNIYGHMGNEDLFRFSILAPWYRAWWAYTIYFFSVVFGLVSLINLRVKRAQRLANEVYQKEKDQALLREATLRAEAAEAQKEMEKEQMRSRISRDLHDEIGSNLSSISLISQILGKKTRITAKERQRLGDVQRLANETATSMRDIVWFVNPVNDSLEKLFAKMRETANLLLEPIDFSFSADLESEQLETSLNLRRNLFLLYKEALQNIVRHSQAKQVDISIACAHGRLTMIVSDDGVGFDTEAMSLGNGLRNFNKRCEEIEGELSVESRAGFGTKITLIVGLAP